MTTPNQEGKERRFASIEEIERVLFPELFAQEVAARRRVEERREEEMRREFEGDRG